MLLPGEKRVTNSEKAEESKRIHIKKVKRIMIFRKGEKAIKEIPEG